MDPTSPAASRLAIPLIPQGADTTTTFSGYNDHVHMRGYLRILFVDASGVVLPGRVIVLDVGIAHLGGLAAGMMTGLEATNERP